MELQPGEKLGPYEIISLLGQGGMGEVWKARDPRLGRDVAIKVSARQFTKRFEREARTIAALNHPNICTLYDVGPDYLVMEFIEGKPLSGPLPLSKILALGVQISDALDAAHRKGVVHRDLKPGNILLTADHLVKILDFGIAMTNSVSDLPPEAPTALTVPGVVLGTVAYMSPEQARGEPLDIRTDLWSLGVVLYELSTGVHPFAGGTAGTIYEALLTREPRPARELNPALSPAVEAILGKALQKDREFRYQTAADMRADLRRASGQSTEAATAGAPVRRRLSLPVAAGVAVVIAGMGFAASPLRNRVVSLFRSGSPGLRHIVVLPFRNIGNDPANAALCDGLTEVVTSRLTGLEQSAPSLWVVPASEVRRRNVTTEQEANTQFGAALAISGSVQRNADGVRLALNLVDANSLRLVASRLVRSPVSDLAAVEEEALKDIGEMLAVQIRSGDTPANVASAAVPAAYEGYLRAQGLMQRADKSENVEEAMRALNQAIERDPRFALAYSGRAAADWANWVGTKDSRWLDAVTSDAQKALSLDPQVASAHLSLAQAYEASRNPELAAHELQEALRLQPRYGEALLSLGRVLETSGRVPEADAKFREAIALHPDYWGSYSEYALFLGRQGRRAEAEKLWQRVLQLSPDNARAYSNFGSLLVRAGRLDEARRLLEKSNAIAPSYFALANLGTVYIRQDKPQESARAYEQALKLNDKDYRVWAFLAGAYERTGDARARPMLERATSMARDALKREPESPELLAELSYYSAKLGQRSEALDYARQSTLLAPSNPSTLSRTALAFEVAGDRDDALKNIAAALGNGGAADVFRLDPELKQLVADGRFGAIVASRKR